MACAICETRRPRRFCPGVRGDICTICCGTEREVTVSCPFDCEYLIDAHRHEKPAEVDLSTVPNQDVKVTEQFLEAHEYLIMFLGSSVFAGAMGAEGAVDFDVREALEGLIRTHRTLQSGVYYESVPANPLAAAIFRHVQNAVEHMHGEETKRFGMAKTRDAEVLGTLVFLQRMEYDRNNGRKRGRAFLSFLADIYSSETKAEDEAPPSLILP
jgi:hypothetical protein